MKKSLIEKKFEDKEVGNIRDPEGYWYKIYTGGIIDAILKEVRGELKSNKYCKSEVAFHICEKHPEDCDYYIPYEDIEKLLGD